MTCEVAIANRLGIALAADSAVTFSGAGHQTTYASGANKIFQLATNEPVAVMVYNNASLNGVPWELIIKTYRKKLGEGGFPTLRSYCDDLTQFLNTCPEALVTPVLKRSASEDAYRTGFFYVIKSLIAAQPLLEQKDAAGADLNTAWEAASAEFQGRLDGAEVVPSLSLEDLNQALVEALVPLSQEITEWLQDDANAHLLPVVDTGAIARMAIASAFKFGPIFLGTGFTGMVIAGFGRDEFLPGYCDIRFHGFVGTRVLSTQGDDRAIDYENRPSLIQAFARQAMVETFTQGASPQVWKAVSEAYDKWTAEVCRSAASAAGVALSEENIQNAIAQNRDSFTEGWTYAVFDEHLKPLWRVVAGLNIEELAELAETLVLLESLKEKVTLRTQSVGGPIDVAVITKSEGLVWIKRKLYFEPHLNHRYFQRLGQLNGVNHESP